MEESMLTNVIIIGNRLTPNIRASGFAKSLKTRKDCSSYP